MNETLPISLRPVQPEDKNFILNSWLKSYRSAYAVKRMQNEAYFLEEGKVIKDLLNNVDVLIACDAKDPNQIFGYAVSQKVRGTYVLHYVYVKLPFRNCGIAKALIEGQGHKLNKQAASYTHHTQAVDQLSYKYKFFYNPYLVAQSKQYQDEVINNAVN
jgi:GNAT superfamily N-acetyltransferase